MIYRFARISFMNKPRAKLIGQRRVGFLRIAFQIRGGKEKKRVYTSRKGSYTNSRSYDFIGWNDKLSRAFGIQESYDERNYCLYLKRTQTKAYPVCFYFVPRNVNESLCRSVINHVSICTIRSYTKLVNLSEWSIR